MAILSSNWSFDGVSLETAAHNIRLLSPSEIAPARRGQNIVIPGRVGSLHRSKVLGERVVTLAMWVKGTTATDLQTNLETLLELFGRSGERLLERTMADGSIRSIRAEVVNRVEFKPKGHLFYPFVVEFVCADPFWHASSPTVVSETGISTVPYSFTITNSGTAENARSTITIDGSITNPKVTVGATWVQYTGTVNSGSTLVIDVESFTATLDGVDVSGDITHGGAVAWLVIPPGTHTLTLDGSAPSSASIQISFTPLYL